MMNESSDQRELPPTPEYTVAQHRDPEREKRHAKYGIIDPNDDRFNGPVDQVQSTYGDSSHTVGTFDWDDREGPAPRSIYSHSEFVEIDSGESRGMVASVPPYNCFHPADMMIAIENMPDNAMISVGREGSPVFYIWTDQVPVVGKVLDNHFGHRGTGTFSPRGPDELGATHADDLESWPGMSIGDDLDEFYPGDLALVRAWWD